MTLLQLGIGTVNDVVDAPRDAGRKAGKPIPAGLVSSRSARIAAVCLFISGVALAGSVSLGLGAVAVVVAVTGLSYDLVLKGTAWSWLPFAVGIPILPLFGWFGATGRLAPLFWIVTPAAIGAGAALAIGNALVDTERDRVAGVSSIALALGPVAAGRAAGVLFGAIWLIAIGSAVVDGAGTAVVVGVALAGGVPALASLLSIGRSVAVRERAWQAEAVGLAILAAIWLAGASGSGFGLG